MHLQKFLNRDFDRGANWVTQVLWFILEGALFATWLPGSFWRVQLLRLFGAQVGECIVIKPRVRVKFPWRLRIGDHSWIGEGAWIDNLAPVVVGSNVCISQGAYLCTGSHDWAKAGFDLIVKPIALQDKVWVGAFSRVAPGVLLETGAVLALGSVATTDMPAWTVWQGNPAVQVRSRTLAMEKSHQ